MNLHEFLCEYNIRSVVSCFSGGKDSLVATHYTFSQLEDSELEKHVVFVDTTVTIPIALDYVKQVCERFNWPLTILRPEPDFWTLALKRGCPTINRRWCCFNLKVKPILEFTRKLPPQRATITGLRREESRRRRRLPQLVFRRKWKIWSFAPIIDWSEKEVHEYIKEHRLPEPPHYKLGIRETCICGAFADVDELLCVKANFPEFFNQFVELEKKFRKGGSAFYLQNRPYYAKELLAQKIIDDYTDG